MGSSAGRKEIDKYIMISPTTDKPTPWTRTNSVYLSAWAMSRMKIKTKFPKTKAGSISKKMYLFIFEENEKGIFFSLCEADH
jgi:hypothetical protein